MKFETKFNIGDVVICGGETGPWTISSITISKFGKKKPEIRYGFENDIYYYKEEWLKLLEESG